MLKSVFLAPAIVLASVAGSAAAGSLTLPAGERWAVLGARQSLEDAVDLGRRYGRTIPGTRIVRSSNGWLAVIAGPVPATTLDRAKTLLVDRWSLPSDLYLSRGEAYLETVWTAKAPPVVASASYEGGRPVSVRLDDLTLTLGSVPGRDSDRIPILTGRIGERVAFSARIETNPSERVRSQAKVVRLDASSPRPQIVFAYFWGGAHCCTVTQIVSQQPGGAWSVIEAPTLDGDGFEFEDLDGDGAAELLAVDNSFLYAFDSYAVSFAPDAYYRLEGGILRNVTTEPRYRDALRADLRGIERSAAEQPDLWRSNGFLAGWVAAKSRLGEVEEAWARMLPLYDRNSSFGPEECTSGQPLAQCPSGNLSRIPFPVALREHLLKQGYPVPMTAQSGGRAVPTATAQPPSYGEAQAAFNRLSLADRYDLQMLLIAAGHWPAVSTDQFSRRLHEAIQSFQNQAGLPVTGMVTDDGWTALRSSAAPVLRRWSLSPLAHPVAGPTLWVPEGLGLSRRMTNSGVVLERQDGVLRISYDYFPGLALASAYNAVLNAVRPPAAVNFKVLRSDFFVVSSGQGEFGSYTRYHAHRGGILGFTLTWGPSDGNHGDRLATLMSDLFRATVSQGSDRRPPRPAPAVVAASPPPAVAPRSGESDRKGGSSSGSGFIVSSEGHVLTNAHVVDGCSAITLSVGQERDVPARVLARDTTNDLALLKTDLKPQAVAQLRSSIRLGDPVAVFGFPLAGLLTMGGNFTLGNVTALAGVRDDSRILQISAPVQPGNSGGPLLDETGHVVGIVVSKLNAVKLARVTDDIPQNINFAIKAGAAVNFAEAQGLRLMPGDESGAVLKPADLAEKAKSFTGHISCRK